MKVKEIKVILSQRSLSFLFLPVAQSTGGYRMLGMLGMGGCGMGVSAYPFKTTMPL